MILEKLSDHVNDTCIYALLSATKALATKMTKRVIR